MCTTRTHARTQSIFNYLHSAFAGFALCMQPREAPLNVSHTHTLTQVVVVSHAEQRTNKIVHSTHSKSDTMPPTKAPPHIICLRTMRTGTQMVHCPSPSPSNRILCAVCPRTERHSCLGVGIELTFSLQWPFLVMVPQTINDRTYAHTTFDMDTHTYTHARSA